MPKIDYRPLGKTDIKVSSLCVGTMMYGDQMPEDGAHAQMDRCLDAGLNFYDTAELYTVPPKPETQGESERILGSWIKARNCRDKVVIASKVAGRSGFTWIRDGKETRVNAEQIRVAIERSLKNLQTDYIDLYQIHWPDRQLQNFGSFLYGYRHYDESDDTGFEEVLETLDALVREGKIRAVGLSNESPWGVMRYLELAEENNWPRMASIQNCYNLVNRYFEAGLAEIAMQEKVGLLAYSPIGQGYLSGKYLSGQKPEGSRLAVYGRLERYQGPGAEPAIQAYADLANDLGVAPAALAMQFVTTRPWVTSNIFGASNDAQLDVILASTEIEWTKEIERAVNAIHATIPNPCP